MRSKPVRPPKRRQSAIRTPLNRILGAEANVRLLRVVTLAPDSLTRSELGRRAGVEEKGAHLAAQRLEREGILRRVGTGPRQQVQLELRHPLAEPLQALFRAEQARVQRLIANVATAVRALSPDIDAVWIQGAFATSEDRPGEPVVIGILAPGAALPRAMKTLRLALGPIEKNEDVSIEVDGYTRPDLAALKPKEAKELAAAIPILGAPPGAFTAEGTTAVEARHVVMHGDRDREQALLAQEVAARLVRNPELLDAAKRWLEQRLSTASPQERGDLDEWLSILNSKSPSRLEQFLRDGGERATRLRQTFPFMEVLSAEERMAILRGLGSPGVHHPERQHARQPGHLSGGA